MADTRTRTTLGDSPGGRPQPPAEQPRPAEDGFWIRLGDDLRPLEVAELALAAAGLTWWLLTHIAGMGHGPAIFPVVLACFVTARAANRLRVRAASEQGACDECGGVIRRGDRYVAINRHAEQQDRRGVVTVHDAEGLAVYHPACAPTVDESMPEAGRS